jgi:hypothetical protein
MDRDYTIQLGTLCLGLDASTGSSSSPTLWHELRPEYLKYTNWKESDVPLVQTLLQLLDDPGLGFTATYRQYQDECIIRATLIPSDAPTSEWKRTRDRINRPNALFQLFRDVYKSWEGRSNEGLVLGRTVNPKYPFRVVLTRRRLKMTTKWPICMPLFRRLAYQSSIPPQITPTMRCIGESWTTRTQKV